MLQQSAELRNINENKRSQNYISPKDLKSNRPQSAVFLSNVTRFRDLNPVYSNPDSSRYCKTIFTNYVRNPEKRSAVFMESTIRKQEKTLAYNKIDSSIVPKVISTTILGEQQLYKDEIDGLYPVNMNLKKKLFTKKDIEEIRENDPYSVRNMYYRRKEQYGLSYSRSLIQSAVDGIDCDNGIFSCNIKKNKIFEIEDPYISTVCTNSIPMNGDIFSGKEQLTPFRMKYEDDPQSLGPKLKNYRIAVSNMRSKSEAMPTRIFKNDKETHSRLSNKNFVDKNGIYVVDKNSNRIFIPNLPSLPPKSFNNDVFIVEDDQPQIISNHQIKTIDVNKEKKLDVCRTRVLQSTLSRRKTNEVEKMESLPTFIFPTTNIYVHPSHKNFNESQPIDTINPKIDFVSNKRPISRISSPFKLNTTVNYKKEQKSNKKISSTSSSIGPGSYNPYILEKKSFHLNTTGEWI